MKVSIAPSGVFPNASQKQVPPVGHPAREYAALIPPGCLFEGAGGWAVVRDPDQARTLEKARRVKIALHELRLQEIAAGRLPPQQLPLPQVSQIDSEVETDPYWSTVVGYETQIPPRLWDGVNESLYGIAVVPSLDPKERLTAVTLVNIDSAPQMVFTTEPRDPTTAFPEATLAQLQLALDAAIRRRALANLDREFQAVLAEMKQLLSDNSLSVPKPLPSNAETVVKNAILAADLCGAIPPQS